MKKFIPKESFVLRAKMGNYFIYAALPKNLSPDHTDNIDDALKFDERDKGRFSTLIKFRNAISGLHFEVFQIK